MRSVESTYAEPWHVAAFSGAHPAWQHQIFNGLPTLGMALPLLAAGVLNVTLLHNGLFNEGFMNFRMVGPSCLGGGGDPTGSWRAVHVSSIGGAELRNLVVPVPMPYGVGHQDSYPTFAFRWAKSWIEYTTPAGPAEQPDAAATGPMPAPHAHHRGHAARAHRRAASDGGNGSFVALILRPPSGARAFDNENDLVRTLVGLFEDMATPLRLVRGETPPSFYRHARGLIGIHGGAFGNMIALPRGARVVEIVHRNGPRCWASTALGLGLEYFTYFPRSMPEPPTSNHGWLPRRDANHSQYGVELDVPHFVQFVREV